MKTIVFGNGCFWCTEAVFLELKGVMSAEPGYSGGRTANPIYQQVCNGTTGHAEVIKVTYDPEQISFRELLTVFFASHDPTTVHRQGNDVGEQYRSIIFYQGEEEHRTAEEYIKEIQASIKDGTRVVTELKPFEVFYPAEDYHKNYYESHKNQSYCMLVIEPKIEKIRKEHDALLKSSMSKSAKK